MTEIEDLIRDYGVRFLTQQNDLAEADLRSVLHLGDLMKWDHPGVQIYVKESGLEVVWQNSPADGLEYYRGLRRDGRWVIDHRPTWPFEPDNIRQ